MTLLPEVEQAMLRAVHRSNARSGLERRISKLGDAAYLAVRGGAAGRAATAYQAWRLAPASRGRSGVSQWGTDRMRPRFALGALAGAAVTAGVLVAVIGLGTGAQQAFAGWSAKPTHPSDAQIGNAEDRCDAQLAANTTPAPFSTAQVGDWQVGLSDTRGPFTYMVLTAGDETALCFSAPSYTRLAGYSQSAGLGAPPDAIQIQSSGVQILGADGQPYMGGGAVGSSYRLVEGLVGSTVASVTLVLEDGTRVTATVGDGLFAAWWPGTQNATTAVVATATGTTLTQGLSSASSGGTTPIGTGHTGPTPATGSSSGSGSG